MSANGAGMTRHHSTYNAVTAHINSDSLTLLYCEKGEKKTGYFQTKDGPGLLAAPRSLHQYP